MNVNKPYNISIDKARALCSRLHLMYFVYSFLIDSFDILFESVMAQNKGKDKDSRKMRGNDPDNNDGAVV